MSQSQSKPGKWICECENTGRGLFIWCADPDWWSCVQCDGRVRPLTEAEESAKQGEGHA